MHGSWSWEGLRSTGSMESASFLLIIRRLLPPPADTGFRFDSLDSSQTKALLRIRRKHPHLPRPYQAPAPRLIGVLAFSITLFFIFLYLPGSPSALLWPYEWLIVLAWATLGFVFALSRRRYAAAMSKEEQAEMILGDYTRYFR